MLPCNNCVYKRRIPGSTHINCAFYWEKSDKTAPTNTGGIETEKPFFFPMNYDPILGEDNCDAFATEENQSLIRIDAPLERFFSLIPTKGI